MNSLDNKISELYAQVSHLKGWDNARTFNNYIGLRNMIDSGIYTRSLTIWLLKESIHANKAVA